MLLSLQPRRSPRAWRSALGGLGVAWCTNEFGNVGPCDDPYGNSPLMANPTGNDFNGNPIPYDPKWYPTLQTAQTIAQQTGGTVVDTSGAFANNQPQYMVNLPNGVQAYAGVIASLYTNPAYAGNQKVIDGEIEKVVNSDACLTEWGNVVSNCSAQRQGTYTVKDGQFTYNPKGVTQGWEAPVLSQSQYGAWLAKQAAAGATGYGNSADGGSTGTSTAPASSSAPATGGAPATTPATSGASKNVASGSAAGAPSVPVANSLLVSILPEDWAAWMSGSSFGVPRVTLAGAALLALVYMWREK